MLTLLTAPPDIAPVDERRLMARVSRRFIPLAFVCYVVAYIDRVNVGFVATDLQRELGLSATTTASRAGLFFLGYCVFEIPSNLILERVGARRWIARIMITWGVVSMATMFVRSAATFMVARVLLGIAEAGFFPGIVLFFTYWFPASERARTGALFMMASPVAVIIGAPLSTWILRLDGLLGLRGWQWLFLIEGLPAVVLGFVVLNMLTDRPEDARWLSPNERAWLARRMAGRSARTRAPVTGRSRVRSARGRCGCSAPCSSSIRSSTTACSCGCRSCSRTSRGSQGFALSVIDSDSVRRRAGGDGVRRARVGPRGASGAATWPCARWRTAVGTLHRRGVSAAHVDAHARVCDAADRHCDRWRGRFLGDPAELLGGAAAAAGIGLINAVGGARRVRRSRADRGAARRDRRLHRRLLVSVLAEPFSSALRMPRMTCRGQCRKMT